MEFGDFSEGSESNLLLVVGGSGARDLGADLLSSIWQSSDLRSLVQSAAGFAGISLSSVSSTASSCADHEPTAGLVLGSLQPD